MHRILIVGSGGIGKRHIRGFQATKRAQLSIVEPDDDRRHQAQEEYGIQTGYRRLEDAPLAELDAAVIAAPASAHIPLALACTAAKLPFLVEKPLAIAMDGVDELCAKVAAAGLVARIGYVRRAAPETQYIRQAIERGEIGEVKLSYINISQDYPHYRPDYREIYYARRDMGGGAILDCASHPIDLAMWFLGPICEVAAMYDHMALEGVEVEDTILLTLRTTRGCMAQININQFQKPNTATVEVIGTRGNLLFDGVNRTLKLGTNDSGSWKQIPFTHDAGGVQPGDLLFKMQAEAFLDAVEGKADCLATIPEGRDNLRVAIAARDSFDTKRIIQL